MAKFIVRRLLLMLLTMLIVSVVVFLITEATPGNVARNVLGIQVTPEQEASFLAQVGLDKPVYERYVYWLIGSDWRAASLVGMPLRQITTPDGFREWWAEGEDGALMRWKLEGDNLIARRLWPDGRLEESLDNERWRIQDPAGEAARLTAYAGQVLEDVWLTEADRTAIQTQLDRILGILRDPNQTPAGLSAALAEPEAALEAMISPEAMRQRDALRLAAAEMAKDELMLAASVYPGLAAGGELKTSELQAMMRRLNRAAEKLQKYDGALAEQLRQVAKNLSAGDVSAARQTLSQVADTYDRLTGWLGPFSRALGAADYPAAVAALRRLADPTETPMGEAQRALIPAILRRGSKALSAGHPELGSALAAVADQLNAGDTAAYSTAQHAADVLTRTSQDIARTDVAKQARVARSFWGVDTQNHAVLWQKGVGKDVWVFVMGTGWMASSGGPVEYIPLQRGLLRGDPGMSLRTARPVADLLFPRLRNSLVLAGIAFVIVMPLALILGVVAGLNEGKPLDRALSVGGMMFSVTPEFATGIFLILIFAFWLKLVPGATVFGESAPWTRPDMLVLPVLTLTLIELGYVLRITRASMVEVMKAAYVRTAFLKGLPYRRIVFRHVMRNALMAPITVIMLHVNWLLGGIVIVEVIFGYPGLGSYLLDSALFKDFNAIEAGAMVLVAVAVGTQLLADIAYTFLNPRIRYG